MSITNLAERPALSFNTETEIVVLPDGQVVVADLPAELAALLLALGQMQPCEIGPESDVRPNSTEER